MIPGYQPSIPGTQKQKYAAVGGGTPDDPLGNISDMIIDRHGSPSNTRQATDSVWTRSWREACCFIANQVSSRKVQELINFPPDTLTDVTRAPCVEPSNAVNTDLLHLVLIFKNLMAFKCQEKRSESDQLALA